MSLHLIESQAPWYCSGPNYLSYVSARWIKRIKRFRSRLDASACSSTSSNFRLLAFRKRPAHYSLSNGKQPTETDVYISQSLRSEWRRIRKWRSPWQRRLTLDAWCTLSGRLHENLPGMFSPRTCRRSASLRRCCSCQQLVLLDSESIKKNPEFPGNQSASVPQLPHEWAGDVWCHWTGWRSFPCSVYQLPLGEAAVAVK